jgi:hypothetical protein
MDIDGKTAPTPHRVSTPDDLAPHYMPRSDLDVTAKATGWNEDAEGRWSCPPCSSKRTPSG